MIEECLNGQAVAYEYDANGNRLKTRLPSGDRLGYFYYGSGHLSGIKFNHQLITDIHRNALHQEICRSQGELTTHYQYNPLGQLTHQQTVKQSELAHPQNTPQIDRTYGYDELGHLIQTRTHCPQQPFEAPQQTQYQYDSLGRIQQEKSGTQRHTFYFDPASNLINDPTEKVINNRLSHYQGVRYTYDSLGNLTECQTANGDYQRYTYDLKHQLIRADIHNRYTTESWVYDYDPLGRRIAKSKLNKQGEKQCHTQFIWAGSHLVQEIRKGKNGEETDRTFTYIYTHPDSYEPLAQCYKESENAQHTVNYFHCDQIGVPREMTDSQGKLIWKGRCDAWGQLIHDSNRHAQRSTHQPFRLQNQYFDQETGLHYNFLRYYEPALGRFITQDPIGLMGGMNVYQFASNVQTWIDPLGLAVVCTRPLSMLTDLPKVGDFKFETLMGTDIDLALNHTHIFYGDGSNLENADNIGYGNHGIFKETDPKVIKKYKCDTSNIYDDSIMRRAVGNISLRKDGLFSKGLQYDKDNYGIFLNNCQDFKTESVKEYYRIINKKKSLRDILIQ